MKSFPEIWDIFVSRICSRSFPKSNPLFLWAGPKHVNIPCRSTHYFCSNVNHEAKVIENTLKMGPLKIQNSGTLCQKLINSFFGQALPTKNIEKSLFIISITSDQTCRILPWFEAINPKIEA